MSMEEYLEQQEKIQVGILERLGEIFSTYAKISAEVVDVKGYFEGEDVSKILSEADSKKLFNESFLLNFAHNTNQVNFFRLCKLLGKMEANIFILKKFTEGLI